jgi:hypothetical protein
MTVSDPKILVAGPVNSGKTTLVHTLSETDVVETDEVSSVAIGKVKTTVAFDFGTRRVEGQRVFIFGTPGQERFDFMWTTLGQGSSGLILLVAADRPADYGLAARILSRLQDEQPMPYVVGLTRGDMVKGSVVSTVAGALDVPDALVHPVDPREEASSEALLRTLLTRVT